MSSSLFMELLDLKTERMNRETYIPVDYCGDQEPFGIVIFNVDQGLVSSLETMICDGQAVQIKALPETLQEIGQSFVYSGANLSEFENEEEMGDEEELRADEGGITKKEAADKCSICLDELYNGSLVRKLQCKHKFHGTCIVNWLHTHNSCPLCRFKPLLKLEVGQRRPREDDSGDYSESAYCRKMHSRNDHNATTCVYVGCLASRTRTHNLETWLQLFTVSFSSLR